MTWSDLKNQVLQLMGVTEGLSQPLSEQAAIYAAGLPTAANQALMALALHGRRLVKSLVIDRTEGEAKQNGCFDLSRLAPDFYCLRPEDVYVSDTPQGERRRTRRFDMEGEHLLLLPRNTGGVWTVYYDAYPPTITAATEEEFELPLPPEDAVLAALYMASLLFREDDMQRAMLWKQEFDEGVARLRRTVHPGGGEFVSVSGWCP